jgi:flagellar biosynthesis/type III secretory pathway ATPase
MYAVLVDGDDMNEPVADTVRSIVDGHIVLSRRLAAQNHYPPIDVLSSISRVMTDVVDDNHRDYSMRIRALMATYQEAEDLINIGAYVGGSSPEIDMAIQKYPFIRSFLRQGMLESTDFEQTIQQMKAIVQ